MDLSLLSVSSAISVVTDICSCSPWKKLWQWPPMQEFHFNSVTALLSVLRRKGVRKCWFESQMSPTGSHFERWYPVCTTSLKAIEPLCSRARMVIAGYQVQAFEGLPIFNSDLALYVWSTLCEQVHSPLVINLVTSATVPPLSWWTKMTETEPK